MYKRLLLVFILSLAACKPASAPTATTIVEVIQTPTATWTAIPTETSTSAPTATSTATTTYTPMPTATATPLPSATPTLKPRAATVAPTVRPAATAAAGHIPPVGSGPFSADESASGPWNCIGIARAKGVVMQWQGDFYISVRGGPGDYTISEPGSCRWDSGEQRFVCHYSGQINQQVMRTLYVSCPGCTQQAVALSGRGVVSRDSGSGVCRVENVFIETPTPSAAQMAGTAEPRLGSLYPGSPVVPWDRDAFVKAVGVSRDSVREFVPYFAEIAAGKLGNCSFYWWKYYGKWEAQPGFTGVPEQWYAQYLRYRTILDNLRTGTYPITQICLHHGGNIAEEVNKQIMVTADTSLKQLDALYAEVQAKK